MSNRHGAGIGIPQWAPKPKIACAGCGTKIDQIPRNRKYCNKCQNPAKIQKMAQWRKRQ